MAQDDPDSTVFQLHSWYRAGIYNADVSNIAASANRQLLAKFKTKRKVDEFLRKIESFLAPLNQPIPSLGEGILRFDGKPPPGYAFALQRYMRSSPVDQVFSFFDQFGKSGQQMVNLAALALSKHTDNRQAIDSLRAALFNVEFNIKSRKNRSISKLVRSEKSPLRSYLKQRMRRLREESNKEIISNVTQDQGGKFRFNNLTLTMNITETEGQGIHWIATDPKNQKEYAEGKKTGVQFEKFLSDIRKELRTLIKPQKQKASNTAKQQQ